LVRWNGPNDLAVMDVIAPQTVFFEDRVRGEVTLKDDMPPGQAFLLKIEEGGQDGLGKSVDHGTHAPPEDRV